MSNFMEIDYGGAEQVAAAFAQAPDIAREELLRAVTEADSLLEREVREATPTAHGLLRAGMFHTEQVSESGVIGVVGSPLNYAEPVELGTRPHFPPIEPLIDWVKVKLGVPEKEARGVAFLVARKIARSGTKGAFMFSKTLKAQEAAVGAIFHAALARIAERIAAAGGSA